jgi:hypothetical protein
VLLHTYRISSADPSTTWVHLQINFAFIEYPFSPDLSRENKAHGGLQASPGSAATPFSPSSVAFSAFALAKEKKIAHNGKKRQFLKRKSSLSCNQWMGRPRP